MGIEEAVLAPPVAQKLGWLSYDQGEIGSGWWSAREVETQALLVHSTLDGMVAPWNQGRMHLLGSLGKRSLRPSVVRIRDIPPSK